MVLLEALEEWLVKINLPIFGELSNYAYGLDIYSFLYKLDVEPISLRKGKLIDRGSLLTL